MVRTVATAVRASGGKSSKAAKTSTTPKTANTSSSSDRHAIGGNSVCPRETPAWQKPITNFFAKHMEDPCKINIPENKPEESNTDKTADTEFLGEGCSTMDKIEKNCDEFSNKENAQSYNNIENKHEEKSKSLIASNENKSSIKKQNLDFYKHLEEIEKI